MVVTSLLAMVQGNRLQGFLTGPSLDNTALRRFMQAATTISTCTRPPTPPAKSGGRLRWKSENLYMGTLTGAQEVPAVTTAGLGVGSFVLVAGQDHG